ncbi:MAG: anti-sigma factor antagonist [Clostridia bacterium]|nr:anti-sigma factor antagonist [Clostridia bacterium]
MQVNSKVINQTLYLSILGELDEHSAQYIRGELDQKLLNNFYRQVVLDLSGLKFMDSTGIGVLIGRYKKAREKNAPMFISNPTSHIDKILKMTAVYDIMPKIN